MKWTLSGILITNETTKVTRKDLGIDQGSGFTVLAAVPTKAHLSHRNSILDTTVERAEAISSAAYPRNGPKEKDSEKKTNSARNRDEAVSLRLLDKGPSVHKSER